MLQYKVKKALILDVDGTIRRSKSGKTFPDGPDDIELIPGMERLIWRYKSMGYLIMAVTNQGGVAFGYKTIDDVYNELKATMQLFKADPFNNIVMCPFHEDGTVEPYNIYSLSRKPNIGMLVMCEQQAFQSGFCIDWRHSLFVGDRAEDQECAERAGMNFRHVDEFLSKPTADDGADS